MRIVFPDGAGCVQHPSNLDRLRKLGPVDFHDGPPPDKATLIERLRPAEAVVLDYSEMDAEVLRACDKLRFISFLGMGVQEPASSWGTLVSEGAEVMEIAPWALFGPAAMLAVTLLCLNFIGDGLRDALDPKDR